MDIEGVLAITFIFGGGALWLLSLSPVGKAWADAIRSRTAARFPLEADPQLVAEVEQLRQEVAELHERMDFTERLLAQKRETDMLPGGGMGSTP